jgi:DNA repair protein RecO (recombination protein O)
MSFRVESEYAFVLHTRPYRNTSLLVDLFTENHGRILAVAKSARGPRSRYKNSIHPFSPLWVNWTGRGELRNLGHVENRETIPLLMGKTLYCGLYVNELLVKLLPREEAFPALFLKYSALLKAFVNPAMSNEITLRYFEKHLLDAIGYGLSLNKETHSGKPMQPNLVYKYIPKTGFLQTSKNNHIFSFSGKALLAFHEEMLQETHAAKEIKRLMRMAISDALDYKKINARLLF